MKKIKTKQIDLPEMVGKTVGEVCSFVTKKYKGFLPFEGVDFYDTSEFYSHSLYFFFGSRFSIGFPSSLKKEDKTAYVSAIQDSGSFYRGFFNKNDRWEKNYKVLLLEEPIIFE